MAGTRHDTGRARAPRGRTRSAYLPLTRPNLGKDVEAEVLDTLRSGWLSTGPKVARFERDLGDVTGAPHVVAVNSCTAALHLALLACGVGPGDEVVVPTITFPATANAVLHCGATPVLADVEPATLNIDPTVLPRYLSARCRAVIPVHMAGQPADLDAIAEVTDRARIVVIDDAAHAVGARLRDRPIGSVPGAAATCLSFHPAKSVTTAEGGAVLTSSAALASTVRVMSNHGLDRDSWARRASPDEWEASMVGFKYNLTDVAASIGIHQLRRLESEIDRRAPLALRYRERLAGTPVRTLEVLPDRRHSWQLMVVVLPVGIVRGAVRRTLHEANIGSGVHFPPLHHQRVLRARCVVDELPVADDLAPRLLSLPLFGDMTTEDVDDAVDALLAAVGGP